MRVFVTGAAGFVGLAVTSELIDAGHRVLGLSRSDSGAAALAALGAEVHRGDVTDLDDLKAAAAGCDGVIHLAFNHDFSRYLENCEDDRRVIAGLAEVLVGKPLLVTSGAAMGAARPGKPSSEEDPPVSSKIVPRAASEEAAEAAAAQGVRAGVVRLPQVHDIHRQGFVTYLIQLAQAKGVCAYVGEGTNRWTAAHVSDVARLYRLALERGQAGARWNAVAEGGLPMKAIAEAIGARLGLPVRSIPAEAAGDHFGWMAAFAAGDSPASSALTQDRLGWTPTGPSLLEDLANLVLDEA